MATLASLKKQIAALEAKVQRVTKDEMQSAITKVRKLMTEFGVTIEHLTSSSTAARGRPAGAKTAAVKKTAAKSKGAKPAKYMDPKSGSTWSGLGRVPHWIANAKDRDTFLIGSGGAPAEAKPAVKSAPAKKAAKSVAPVKKAAKAVKTMKPAKAAAPQPAAKAPAKKATAKKVVAKKAAAKKSAPAPMPALPAPAAE
jgi:DNA-binding protein H-NS